MVNQYSRTELLIGAEGMDRLKESSVMVFGTVRSGEQKQM